MKDDSVEPVNAPAKRPGADDAAAFDAPEWRSWAGGTCPVQADRMIEVERRYAGCCRGKAGQFRWSHDLYNAYGADDIVRYRAV